MKLLTKKSEARLNQRLTNEAFTDAVNRISEMIVAARGPIVLGSDLDRLLSDKFIDAELTIISDHLTIDRCVFQVADPDTPAMRSQGAPTTA